MTPVRNRNRHEGRVALVTGGARGIGRAISKVLAGDGAEVVALFNESAELARTLQDEVHAEGGSVATVQCDVRDHAALTAELKQVQRARGPIGILVHNAGITRGEPIRTAGLATMRDVFDVNFWPAVAMAQVALGGMMRSRFGRIIFVGSTAGERGAQPGSAAYAASKAALSALARTLAAEVSSRGDITANVVAAGYVETDLVKIIDKAMHEAILATTPAERPGSPEEIAEVVSFLASREASYVTGSVLYADGGYGNNYIGWRRIRRMRR